MNMSTITLFDNSQIAAASATLSLPEKGNASCSVKVVNSSVYPLLITSTSQGGAPVEVLPPYTFAIMPNPVNYTAALLVEKGTGLSAPANQYVTATYIDQVMNYQFGPISELAAGSVPSANVKNTVSTDLGVGFVRLGGGGTKYAGSGVVAVTFTSRLTGKVTVAQQIVLFNQGTANVSFWGDEDGNTGSAPSDAPVLVPGGSFSLAWATQHIYLSSAGTSVPVEVQGWG